MMKINLKLRFQNKVTLTAILLSTVTLVYQLLGIFNVAPRISQDEVVNIIGMVINLFVLLGIVTDPTTKGLGDSKNALTYEKPKEE